MGKNHASQYANFGSLPTFTSVGSDSIESACPDLPLLCLLTGSLSAFHALSSFGDEIYLRAPPVYLFI